MKKLFLILVVVGLAFASCTKVDTIVPKVAKVGSVEGLFKAVYGDISLAKDYVSPVVTYNIWSMYAVNSPFYGNQPFAYVKGDEFITGSAAQKWWAIDGNNPVGFASSQGVYSNLTPIENLRVMVEGQVGSTDAYLGILDFNPTYSGFPLNVQAFRLGDYLSIDATQLLAVPGIAGHVHIYVSYATGAFNIEATKVNKAFDTNSSFGFSNLVYDAPTTYPSVFEVTTAGEVVVYSGYDKKVTGTVTVTVVTTEPSGLTGTSTATATASGAGKGLKLTLTTTKVGWFDSATIGLTDTDITLTSTEVPVN